MFRISCLRIFEFWSKSTTVKRAITGSNSALSVQIEMRKIAVEQLQQLQRARTASDDVITGNDVIGDDDAVSATNKVGDERRRAAVTGDDNGRLQATDEPSQ